MVCAFNKMLPILFHRGHVGSVEMQAPGAVVQSTGGRGYSFNKVRTSFTVSQYYAGLLGERALRHWKGSKQVKLEEWSMA